MKRFGRLLPPPSPKAQAHHIHEERPVTNGEWAQHLIQPFAHLVLVAFTCLLATRTGPGHACSPLASLPGQWVCLGTSRPTASCFTGSVVFVWGHPLSGWQTQLAPSAQGTRLPKMQGPPWTASPRSTTARTLARPPPPLRHPI